MKNTRNKKMEKKIIKNNQEIIYRELDIYGLPIISELTEKQKEREKLIKEEGEIIFEINKGVNPKEKILPNMDYQYSEMTKEQKELFEALDCEEDIYEKLEDDFANKFLGGILDGEDKEMATDGNEIGKNEDRTENKDGFDIKNNFDNGNVKSKDKQNMILKNNLNNNDVGIVEQNDKKNNCEKLIKENLNILEEDVEKLEGDQIKREEFLRIIEEDAKLLNIDIAPKKKDLKKEKADLLKKIQDQILNPKNKSGKVGEEEKTEDMSPDAVLKFQIMNRLPRKNEIILEEKVVTAKGGGTIIFRKIKKLKESIKKKYSYEKEEIKEPEDETKKNFVKKQKFDFDKIDDDNFSLDMEEEEPLTQEEILNLQKNYQKIKTTEKEPKKTELVYFRKNKRKIYTKIEEKEIEKKEYLNGLEIIKPFGKFKKTPFFKEKDLIIKKMAIIDEEEKIEIEDRPLLKRLIDEECELAPEEKIIHENYYCMKIIKEDLEVFPVKLKKDRRKNFSKIEKKEKQDLGFLKRDKNETAEEKKKRKEILKKLKSERKLRKREAKEAFREDRKRAIKEKNCQKNGNPLIGISVHKLI